MCTAWNFAGNGRFGLGNRIAVDGIRLVFQRNLFFGYQFHEGIKTDLFDQELKPGFVATVTLAVAIKHANHAFGKGNNLVFGQEIVGYFGQIGLSSQATTQQYFEAAYFLAVYFLHFGNKTQVVNEADGSVLFAGGKGNFELPAHFLANRVAEKVLKSAWA